MNIIFNFLKDENNIEDGIVYIRALLMQRYIDNLNVNDEIKLKIKENLIKKLRNLNN